MVWRDQLGCVVVREKVCQQDRVVEWWWCRKAVRRKSARKLVALVDDTSLQAATGNVTTRSRLGAMKVNQVTDNHPSKLLLQSLQGRCVKMFEVIPGPDRLPQARASRRN